MKDKNKKWKEQFKIRLFQFALLVIKIANALPRTPAGFAIASQLIKSGTSIGANFISLREAKRDCILAQHYQRMRTNG